MNEEERGARSPMGDEQSVGEIAHGALRGTIAAMAMTGMRAFTISTGLVGEPPPRKILREKSKGLFRVVPKKKRRAVQELMHWGYGASGGAAFAALPDNVRKRPWFGPVFGFVMWMGFEFVQAPLLGLEKNTKLRPLERGALIADHLLYGLVLSETRRRPRE